MIRVAAVGDLHFGTDSHNTLRPHLEHLEENADVFLIAGDLTQQGDPAEAEVLAEELRGLPVPTFAVLGNHDYHLDREKEVAGLMEEAGVRVLEGEGVVLPVNGSRVGIAGTKGFGGGFAGASGSDFGEPEMKLFIQVTKNSADSLEKALVDLDEEIAKIRSEKEAAIELANFLISKDAQEIFVANCAPCHGEVPDWVVERASVAARCLGHASPAEELAPE